MSYRTQRAEAAQQAQQVAYLIQRDRRGSFGEPGQNNSVNPVARVNPNALEGRNLGGVFAPKFPTNSDFWDFQQGQ